MFQDENQAASAASATTTEAAPESNAEAGAATEAGTEFAESDGQKAKSKEEWVTLIFGEDGKEIPAQPGTNIIKLYLLA